MTTIGPWAPVMVTIRAETSDDPGAIFAVHAAAFPTDAEARLVNALRAGGKATVSLVAEVDATVVGHVLFTPVRLEPGPGSCLGVGLAPSRCGLHSSGGESGRGWSTPDSKRAAAPGSGSSWFWASLATTIASASGAP